MTAPTCRQPDFDRLARPYRWLEYLTFGRSLERCRLHFLPRLVGRTCALVLGDGDGRFLTHLLAANPNLNADAVDTSAAMLRLLRQRCEGSSARLRTHHSDALAFISVVAPEPAYDLIVTHFFLDCLTQSQVDTLAASLASRMQPDALWLVSDFHIPRGAMHLPAHALVRALYLAFRILTGLRTRQLPDHVGSLSRAGLGRIAHHTSLFGLLSTELWSLRTGSETNRVSPPDVESPDHQITRYSASRSVALG